MNSNLPLVSVIIPAYNAANYLRKTLDSVLVQTYPAFEIIIVNDGSTDDTQHISDNARASDPRIRVVKQKNAGVGAARNTGIRMARGKYIAPLDADDLWAPRKLEQQVARLETAGPKAGLVYCWSRNIDRQNLLLTWGYPSFLEGKLGPAMLLANFVGNASVPLFRATALADVGLYLTRDEQDGAQGCEDWDLNVRIAEKYDLCCISEYLVSYRQTASSMSLNATAMAKSYEVTLRGAYARDPNLPLFFYGWSASRFYSYLVGKCYSWSDYFGTLHYLIKVMQVDPISWLNGRNYRIGAGALFHLITGGKLRRFRVPPPLSSPVDPLFLQIPPVAARSAGFFPQIQERRLAYALNNPTSPRSEFVGFRKIFGY